MRPLRRRAEDGAHLGALPVRGNFISGMITTIANTISIIIIIMIIISSSSSSSGGGGGGGSGGGGSSNIIIIRKSLSQPLHARRSKLISGLCRLPAHFRVGGTTASNSLAVSRNRLQQACAMMQVTVNLQTKNHQTSISGKLPMDHPIRTRIC